MTDSTETTDTGTGQPRTSEELKQKLSEQIDAARDRLHEMKNELQQLKDEDRESLRHMSDDIRNRLEQHTERARQMRADIANWQKEKVTHTREAIASWQQRREIRKLQNRAERAEEYALRAVTIAAFDFEEAEQAVVDAVAARLDAELAAAH